MVRNVFRRIQRLEARVVASTPNTIKIRVLFVHPEKGLTGILVFETDKPTTEVPPPTVPGDTEAARMDNAVRMLFKASKAEYVKPEREQKTKKRAKRPH
jgi:hypothetical protein